MTAVTSSGQHMGRRLTSSVRRDADPRREIRAITTATAGTVLILFLVHWVAVAAIAGAPGPQHHLAYLPILFAAYRFGLCGALLVAVAAALVSGPFPVLVKLDPATWAGDTSTALRVVMFLAVAIVTGVLFDRVRHARDDWRATALRVTQREREGVVALARGAEAKDADTGNHIRRVQLVSERLARATGMEPSAADALGWAAMLHDVGKLHVPDHILSKPGALTPEEMAIMRMHPIWGEQILSESEGFTLARLIARSHHEDFDGSGYPDGLSGAAISLEARIVRVADAVDTMIHGRAYQAAVTLDEAVSELRACAGRQFDPELVRLLIDLFDADAGFASLVIGPAATSLEDRMT